MPSLRISGHLLPSLLLLYELGELSQWLYHDDNTINIIVVLLLLHAVL